MVIDETAAFQVLRALPTLDDARRERAARMLRDYQGQQERLDLPLWPSRVEELNKRRERVRSVFDNPLSLDAEDGTFSAADAVQPGTGDKMRKREANILYLADTYQADEADVRTRYDFYKADAGAKWGTGSLDDEAFFTKAKGEVDTARATEQRRMTVAQQAAAAALSGQGFLDSLATSGAEDDGDKAAFRAAYTRINKKLSPYRGLIGEVAKDAKRMMTSGEGADWSALAERLLTVPKKDRPMVLDALNSMEGEEVKADGTTSRLAHAFARGLEDYIERTLGGAQSTFIGGGLQMVQESARLRAEAGLGSEEEAEFGEQAGASAETLADLREMAQDARAIANGTLSPLKNVRVLGANLTGVAENLPMTFAAFVPFVGPASMVANMRDATDEELRREYPEMDRATRGRIATLSAPIQAATEVVSNRLLFGRLPNLKRAFSSPAFTASSIAKQLAGRVALGTATEYLEELAQGITPRAIMEVEKALGADVPEVAWGEYFQRFGENTGELLAVIVPLALLGAGVGQVSDYQNGRALVSNETLLKAAGYDNAAEIAAASAEGRWTDVEGMMRAKWAEVAPNGQSVGEVAAEAQETVIQQRTEEVKAATAEVVKIREQNEQAAAAVEQAEKMRMIPRIRRDAQGWTVQDVETGSIVRVGSRDEAVSMAYESLNDLERKSAEAMAQGAEEFLNLDPTQAGVMEIRRQGATPQTLAEEGVVTPEQAQAGVETYAQMHGLTPEEAKAEALNVLGNNKAEMIDGVRTAVSRVMGGGNLITVIHEGIHGRWNEGLRKGHYTHGMGIQWVRMAERATGVQFLPTSNDAEVTPAQLDEAIAEVGSADLVGRRKDGKQHFTAGLISRGVSAFALSGRKDAKAAGKFAAWLKSWKSFWGVVLSNAKKLKKARAEGKLGEDFDSFLDDLLGAEPQQRFEAQAAQEAVTMAGEVDNAPFSLSPAGMASNDGAAQNAEPSTGGLTESEVKKIFRKQAFVEELKTAHPATRGDSELAQNAWGVYQKVIDLISTLPPQGSLYNWVRQNIGIFQDPSWKSAALAQSSSEAVASVQKALEKLPSKQKEMLLFHGSPQSNLTNLSAITADDIQGVYLTSREDYAKQYGPSLYTAVARYKMPLDLRKPWTESFVKKLFRSLSGQFPDIEKYQAETIEILEEGPLQKGEFSEYASLVMVKNIVRMFIRQQELSLSAQSRPSIFDSYDAAIKEGKTHEEAKAALDRMASIEAWKAVTATLREMGVDAIFRQELQGNLEEWTTVPVNLGIDPESVVILNPDQVFLLPPESSRAEGGAFSLAPRSLASVADTVLASRMKKPEFREAFYGVARQKLEKLRSDGEWKVDKWGNASRRTGTDTMAANTRTAANIENERKFRLRSRQRELVEAGMNALSPAKRMALEKGTEKWQDNATLAAIFENGKLMSKTTATRLGKYDPKTNGDYDAAPGWLPPAMYGKGDSGTMPDVLAQQAFDAGLIPEPSPDALWNAIRAEMDRMTKDNEEARAVQTEVREIERNAAKQAKQEADAWAKEERAKVPTPKERQMAALRTLDAILSAFPPEIRGRVGGFVKLASLGTDKAREAEIVKRLDLLDSVVEKEAKKFYRTKIEDTFEKAKPKKGKAGEKPKGKLGAEAQALVDLARTFSALDELGVSAERAAIADRMAKETDPAKVADLFEREQLLDLFGALDERTSAELEAAAAWLSETYDTGRNRWRAVIEQREEQTRAQRAQAREEIGLQGLDAEQQKALEEARTITKRAAGVALSWLSFEQVMTSILGRGSKLARDVVRQARAATTRKTDALREKRAAFKATMSGIFGTTKQREWQDKMWNLSQIGGVQVVKMEGARTETRTVAVEAVQRIIEGKATAKAFGLDALKLDKLADAWAENDSLPANRRKENLSFEVPTAGTATPTRLSQLQAVNITMLARQPGYTENMAGHGWTAEVLEEIENQLTPEAKAIRDWLAGEYRNGYDSLNEVYARMYGVNLPRLVNYSPGTFEAMDMMGQDIDPYGQGLLSEGGFRAGMTITRGNHKAAPRLEDALSVYWSHVNATEHFKAFGEFARDLRGVMNNAEVRKSIKAKGGKDLLEAGQNWIGAFERNGVENRSTSSAFDEFIRRRQASQAYLALAYNMGTLMKQSTAALASLLNMGPGAAARQFAKLVSGGLDLKAAYNSEVIQRRMDAGYSPEVRQAMAAMMAERPSWGTGLVQKGMEIIGVVDAVFTTASYAMAYDYHLQSAKDAGMNDALAQTEAEREAEATVARTAQPSEMMDRSLFEMGLQPTGKFLFMFASEARQKAAMALEAYSPSSGLSKGERATRLLLLHVVFPLAIQTITNLWRDAREDDDEELFDSDNWRAGDYAKAMLLGPLTGIPLVGSALNASLTPIFGGHYFPNDPTQPLNRALGGGADILEAIQEGDLESGLKGARSLMWALALAMGGEKAAAVGVGSNILYDAFRVTENLVE
jgi:hypothetical protein